MTKEHQKIRKNMKNSIGILRTEYVYQKYAAGDEAAAEKAKAAFEKAAVKYPYAQDVEAERELLAFAEEKLQKEE